MNVVRTVKVASMRSRHTPRVAKWYAVESQSLRALHCIGQSHVQELHKDIWLIKHDCGIRDRRSQNWIRDCESALRYASLVQMSRLNARVIVGREMIAPNIQGNGLAQLHGF